MQQSIRARQGQERLNRLLDTLAPGTSIKDPNEPRKGRPFGTQKRRDWLMAAYVEHGTCTYCGRQCDHPHSTSEYRATVDHVVPLSAGGFNAQHNRALACYSCNHQKGSKALRVWKKETRSTQVGLRTWGV